MDSIPPNSNDGRALKNHRSIRKLKSNQPVTSLGQEADSRHLDAIHEKVWENSPVRTGTALCILANFYNLQILPKLEKEFGILRDDFNILFCLAEAGPMTGSEVCRITGRPRNSISRCAERLVQRKLIKAQGKSVDRRLTVFELMGSGRQIYTRMLPHFIALENRTFGTLTSSERAALDRLLMKLIGSPYRGAETK